MKKAKTLGERSPKGFSFSHLYLRLEAYSITNLSRCARAIAAAAIYVRAAALSTAFAGFISLSSKKLYSSSMSMALLEALNSTGRVISWNATAAEKSRIPASIIWLANGLAANAPIIIPIINSHIPAFEPILAKGKMALRMDSGV